jgi:hypothetical protein
MPKRARWLAPVAVILAALPGSSSLLAQETARTEGSREEPHEEAERPNELALVLGGTHEHDANSDFFTVGGEYERRLGGRFGVGITAEYVTDLDAFVLVAPLVFRPVPRLKLFVGPGLESKPEEPSEIEKTEGAEPERTTSFLLRLGAGYSFEFGGRYSFTPTLELDVLAEDEGRARAFLYGASFGVAF